MRAHLCLTECELEGRSSPVIRTMVSLPDKSVTCCNSDTNDNQNIALAKSNERQQSTHNESVVE